MVLSDILTGVGLFSVMQNNTSSTSSKVQQLFVNESLLKNLATVAMSKPELEKLLKSIESDVVAANNHKKPGYIYVVPEQESETKNTLDIVPYRNIKTTKSSLFVAKPVSTPTKSTINPKILKNEDGLIIAENVIPKEDTIKIVEQAKDLIEETSFKQTAGAVSWGYGKQWMRINAMTPAQREGLVIGKQLNGYEITQDMKDNFIKTGNSKGFPLYGYTTIDKNGNKLPPIPKDIVNYLSSIGIDISQYDASYNSVYDKEDAGSLIIHQDNTETNKSPIITISLGRPMKFITYELTNPDDFNVADSNNTAFRIAVNAVSAEALKLNLIPQSAKDKSGKIKYGHLTPDTLLKYAEQIDKKQGTNLKQFVIEKLKEQFKNAEKTEYNLKNGAVLVFSGKNRNVLHEIVFDPETNEESMESGFPTLKVNKAFKGLNQADRIVDTNDYRVVLTLRKVEGPTLKNVINEPKLISSLSTQPQAPLTSEEIYTQLGDKTQIPNIEIDNVAGRKASTSKGIVAYRTRDNNFLEAFEKDRTIGNPWNSRGYGLYKTKSVKESVIEFTKWLTGEAHTDKLQDYRQAIIDNLDNLRGKKIIYYEELNEPSHATALYYLVNKYDWSKPTTPTVSNYIFTYARTSDNSYEVSTAGDTRFSALHAVLKDGRTIEEAYQLDIKGYRKYDKGDKVIVSGRFVTEDEDGNEIVVDNSKAVFEKEVLYYGNEQGLVEINIEGDVFEVLKSDIVPFNPKDKNWKKGKGKKPLIPYNSEDLYVLYKELWKEFFNENPRLLEDLRQKAQGKVLTDKFASSAISQARALADILNETSQAVTVTKTPTTKPQSSSDIKLEVYIPDYTLAKSVHNTIQGRVAKGENFAAVKNELYKKFYDSISEKYDQIPKDVNFNIRYVFGNNIIETKSIQDEARIKNVLVYDSITNRDPEIEKILTGLLYINAFVLYQKFGKINKQFLPPNLVAKVVVRETIDKANINENELNKVLEIIRNC
jgi:alkylated DNA repair dioxygenase AlkB